MVLPSLLLLLLQLELPLRVYGDLHGQLVDLLDFFGSFGWPEDLISGLGCSLLFLGDFVDRGIFSCEVLLLLLSFKVLVSAPCPHLAT